MLDSNLIIILSMYSNYYSITVFLSSLPISQTYTLLISILEWDHQTIVQWERHFLYGEQNKKSMYYYYNIYPSSIISCYTSY